MSLSIKNAKTTELAHKLAALTGETLTQTVTIALEERLAKMPVNENQPIDKEARLKRILALVEESSKLWTIDEEDPTAFLYDDYGIPK